jgi:hypothetical protein
MYRKDVIGVQCIADVLDQWERPTHDWGETTAWRLFNATFALAGNVAENPGLMGGGLSLSTWRGRWLALAEEAEKRPSTA